jgi:hypothetical protein
LRAGNDAATLLSTLPVDPSAHLREVKCVGPVLICVYFF